MLLNRVDKIFICHWDALKERKERMLADLVSLNLENTVEWVQNFTQDELRDNFYDLVKIFPLIDKPIAAPGTNRKLRLSELSLALKHIYIIHEIYSKKLQNAYVLEDDATFEPNFVARFNAAIEQLPADYDIFWTGTCCGIKSENVQDGKYVYKTNKGSRCTHGFLLSYGFSVKVLDQLQDLNNPMDFFFNYLVIKNNLNNYWCEPPLNLQRSEYASTVQQ